MQLSKKVDNCALVMWNIVSGTQYPPAAVTASTENIDMAVTMGTTSVVAVQSNSSCSDGTGDMVVTDTCVTTSTEVSKETSVSDDRDGNEPVAMDTSTMTGNDGPGEPKIAIISTQTGRVNIEKEDADCAKVSEVALNL